MISHPALGQCCVATGTTRRVRCGSQAAPRPELARVCLSAAVTATGVPICSSGSCGILARDADIEVMGPPRRLYSNFIRGIRELPVRIKA